MSAALAGVCTATALLLLVPAGRRLGRSRDRSSERSPAVLVGVGAGAVACWALAGSTRLLVLSILAMAVTVGGGRLWAEHVRSRRASTARGRVVELCDALQAELCSGQTPGNALDRAAVEWPPLAPVARTALAGGDVPGALRRLSVEPGAAELRVVAAAWQVAHRTGHGLADALGRVAEDLRASEHTRGVVAGELSSARATARLLAGLPVAALLMGSGAGADPWRFLVGHPLGLACLAGGLGFGYLGLAWIEALARGVDGDRR